MPSKAQLAKADWSSNFRSLKLFKLVTLNPCRKEAFNNVQFKYLIYNQGQIFLFTIGSFITIMLKIFTFAVICLEVSISSGNMYVVC